MKRFFIVLFLVFGLTNTSMAIADVKTDVASAINEAMAFGSMFPPGTKNVTASQHEIAANHLKKAINYGVRPDRAGLEKSFSKSFASEWYNFVTALKYRLDGWQKPNIAVSTKGINGMERFRDYYNKNSEWINKRINDVDEGSSWFSWNPSRGELLPKIGCEKGAVIAWLAGCG
jgi:hypothetical protein